MLVRALGHGATGSVVLARQVSLDRLVAIKVLHAGGFDTAGHRRLQREGRALVALRHPHVVTVHEFCETPTGPALVMEYVSGGDLRSAMSTLTWSQVPGLLSEIASALEHAHAAGVVHRDLKPANVLLGPTGQAKIADFGLARLTAVGTAFRTASGQVSGTPAYLAPEQIRDPGRELAASDTYAFAVLCYELLTGRGPYQAAGVAGLVEAHLFADPVPPWEWLPELDRAAGRTLLAGLAKRPGDRPTPSELAAALAGLDWEAHLSARPEPEPSEAAGQATVSATTGSTAGTTAGAPTGSTAVVGFVARAATRSSATSDRPSPGRRRALVARLAVCAVVVAGFIAGATAFLAVRR